MKIQPPPKIPCNCRVKNNCPLNGDCMSMSVVYKVSVKFEGVPTKFYIGSTSNSFKDRFYKHTHSFKNEFSGCSTTLSKYCWYMKKTLKKDPILKWEIISRAPTYKAGSKFCRLCNEEKFFIVSWKNSKNLLNKRLEVLNTCMHRRKCLVYQ